MAQSFQNYAEFWVAYLDQRRRPEVRGLHYFGTGFGLMLLAKAALVVNPWFAVAAVFSFYGYGPLSIAWFNREWPRLLRHPLWSLASDFRLLALFATFKLDDEYRRLGLAA